MKRRYEFHKNPDDLPRSSIEEHQDFDVLLQQYEAAADRSPQPTLRRIWLYGAAAVAAGLVGFFLLVGLPSEQPSYEERAQAYFMDQPYLAPPVPPIPGPAFVTDVLDVDQGGVFNFENGSRIIVPPAAFSNAQGDPVSGEVAIRYRELHDPVDFFLAGIPMQYDSAGQHFQMESAGMMELYAEQNGSPVQIKLDKRIEVELVSVIRTTQHEELPSYQVYNLDTVQRNWTYQDVDEITVIRSLPSRLPAENTFAPIQDQYRLALEDWQNRLDQALEALPKEFPLPPPPVKPHAPDPNAFAFELDLSELNRESSGHQVSGLTLEQLHEGTLWQVHNSPDVTAEDLNRDWADVQLKEESANVFLMTLTGTDDVILQVQVQPVVPGPSYETALQEYETELASYQALRERRESEIVVRKDSLVQQMEREKKEIWANLEEIRTASGFPAQQPWIEHQVVHHFSVDRLGIWNCDRPLLSTGQPQPLQLVMEDGSTVEEGEAYLVNLRRNTLQSFYTGEGIQLPLDQEEPYLLWMVTEDQQLAIARWEDKLPLTSNEPVTFTFTIEPNALRSEEDVRSVLAL
jgi:hypothetical protein